MNNKNFKKTILIDLDGVLNTYNGNYDANYIPPVKDGAKEFIEELSKTCNITLFTTRDRTLANEWLKEYELDSLIVKVTSVKEPCYLYIDDRCIRFNGNYSELKEEITNFKVWWK